MAVITERQVTFDVSGKEVQVNILAYNATLKGIDNECLSISDMNKKDGWILSHHRVEKGVKTSIELVGITFKTPTHFILFADNVFNRRRATEESMAGFLTEESVKITNDIPF